MNCFPKAGISTGINNKVLQVLQTCTFYDADNRNEMRAKVNTFSKLYNTLMNRAKTQKTLAYLNINYKVNINILESILSSVVV